MAVQRVRVSIREELLGEALRLRGVRSRADIVELALNELVLRARGRRILDFAGSGVWEGDLSKTRRDRRT